MDDQALSRLAEVRAKHGFVPMMSGHKQTNTSKWSKSVLASANTVGSVPQDGSTFPKNAPLLNLLVEKFATVGFSWRVVSKPDRRGKERQSVVYANYPTIDGYMPTLADLFLVEAELVDTKPFVRRQKKKKKPGGYRFRERERPGFTSC